MHALFCRAAFVESVLLEAQEETATNFLNLDVSTLAAMNTQANVESIVDCAESGSSGRPATVDTSCRGASWARGAQRCSVARPTPWLRGSSRRSCRSHEAAMRGARWTWDNDAVPGPQDVRVACRPRSACTRRRRRCAPTTCTTGASSCPFSPAPAAAGVKRLVHVVHSNEWCCATRAPAGAPRCTCAARAPCHGARGGGVRPTCTINTQINTCARA